MTNLEKVFDIFDCYSYEQIQNRIQEARIYLQNGSEAFSKKVRPIDVTESIAFLKKLDATFTGLCKTGSMNYQLVHNNVGISLEFLYQSFSKENLRSNDEGLKILLSDMRTVLNSDNITIYQNVAEFVDTLLAVLDSIGRNVKK